MKKEIKDLNMNLVDYNKLNTDIQKNNISYNDVLLDFKKNDNNLLIREIMKTSFIMSYGEDTNRIIPVGVFVPVCIDKRQNVVFERKYESDSKIDVNHKENLYIPISKVLTELKITNFVFDDYNSLLYMNDLLVFANENNFEECFNDDFRIVYSLNDLDAKYYINNVKRGNNYTLIPFTVDITKVKSEQLIKQNSNICEELNSYSKYDDNEKNKEDKMKLSF